jgi:thioredoxin reductase
LRPRQVADNAGRPGADAAQTDAVVVGGGPAGLSAATWLGRHRRHTVLIDADEGRNRWVEAVHGHLACDPIRPDELRRRGRRDLDAYPDVDVHPGRVQRVISIGDSFRVTTADATFETHRLVLATGVRDAFPEIDGFFEHYGADVYHCPTCDGFEARDQVIAVIGWGPHVPAFALEMLDWARAVHLLSDGRGVSADQRDLEQLAAHGVHTHDAPVEALLGERSELRGVRLADGTRVECALAFFTIEHRPVNDLAVQLGCELDAEGYVVVDAEGETSVPGVYAAGDLTPGVQLVPVAAAEGTVAGISAAMSLRGRPLIGPDPAPDPGEVLGDA